MNTDVCAALTGIEDCQAYLSNLEERNLFVLPLDHERIWYRYHHLFHEFLLGQLRRQFPAEIVGLYDKAADWFETEGYASEVVEYSLLSGNMSKTVKLVESQVDEEMKAGRMPRVNNWVNKIPNEVCKSHPKLLFAKCTSLYHMNQPDEAEGTLSILRENHELTEQGIREHISIIEAGIAISRDDIDKILPPLADIGVMSSDFDNGTICNIRGYALSELSEYGPAL
jgi:LuxR family maltose regulon positive regulatory protein